MLFPVIQEVTADLIAALRGVTKSAGFATNLRVRVASFVAEPMATDADAIAEVAFDGFEEADESPMGFTDRLVTFRAALFVRAADGSEAPMHDRALIAAADVERAVMRDVTRGDRAAWTELSAGSVLDARDEGLYGAEVFITCLIRHQLDDPFKE